MNLPDGGEDRAAVGDIQLDRQHRVAMLSHEIFE